MGFKFALKVNDLSIRTQDGSDLFLFVQPPLRIPVTMSGLPHHVGQFFVAFHRHVYPPFSRD